MHSVRGECGQRVHHKWGRLWYLKQVRAVPWQANCPEGGTEPPVPDKLPAGLVYRLAAGEGPGNVHRLTVEMSVAEDILVHHLQPVYLLRRQPLGACFLQIQLDQVAINPGPVTLCHLYTKLLFLKGR